MQYGPRVTVVWTRIYTCCPAEGVVERGVVKTHEHLGVLHNCTSDAFPGFKLPGHLLTKKGVSATVPVSVTKHEYRSLLQYLVYWMLAGHSLTILVTYSSWELTILWKNNNSMCNLGGKLPNLLKESLQWIGRKGRFCTFRPHKKRRKKSDNFSFWTPVEEPHTIKYVK